VFVAVASLAWGGLAGSHRAQTNSVFEAFASLPNAPPPAIRIGAPEPLGPDRFLSRWTTVRAAAVAHLRPATDAAIVAHVPKETPEGTPNAVPVLRARAGSSRQVWVEVRVPSLTNDQVGWVRRQALGGYETVTTHLIVDRAHLKATLYRKGRPILSAAVGVGTSAWPTPAGEFIVRNELTRYSSPFYGPVAFGTTARSILSDWPGGGFVGIHGTDEPQLIPGRVSHGCIRMRNSDIVRLAALMPVGTPLTIK
jgi:lipoprotein-anchoring transpeptidase ErfK/SrfK